MYLVNGGLWTACLESRDAMERRYRRTIQDPRLCSLPPSLAVGTSTGRTGFSTHRNATGDKEQRYFTLLTGDLVCYRLRDLVDIYTMDEHFRLLGLRGGNSIEDVALEYDSALNSPTRHDFRDLYEHGYLRSPGSTEERRAQSLICAMEYLPNLWFIDYRI